MQNHGFASIRDVTGSLLNFLKIAKRSERSSRLCGVGSRGPLKGPRGVQGQSPWWGSRGRSPPKPEGFYTFITTGEAILWGKMTLKYEGNIL